jgi:hypothetical protein
MRRCTREGSIPYGGLQKLGKKRDVLAKYRVVEIVCPWLVLTSFILVPYSMPCKKDVISLAAG